MFVIIVGFSSYIYILQGSVEMHIRCGGIIWLLKIVRRVCQWTRCILYFYRFIYLYLPNMVLFSETLHCYYFYRADMSHFGDRNFVLFSLVQKYRLTRPEVTGLSVMASNG